MIKNEGIKLKINSVITRLNYKEDMVWLLEKINPDRWKVFQVLEIKERNCHSIEELLISQKDFKFFVKNHKNHYPIPENNLNMIESYIMIDPLGRFYQNTESTYCFSRLILKVGIVNALNDIKFNRKMFINRGGVYAW